MGRLSAPLEAAVAGLSGCFSGMLVRPGDPAYEDARRIHNGIFVRRPAAIDALLACFALCPSAMSQLGLEHLHGAATRIGVDETAFAHRREGYNLVVISQWPDPKDDEKNVAWARATYDALRPHMVRESYGNYQTEDQVEDALERAYGPNYERLRALKARYDPGNLFHLNQNIRPAS